MAIPPHIIRPRPRVAAIGVPDDATIEHLHAVFQTLYVVGDSNELRMQASPDDIDLIVTWNSDCPDYVNRTHAICFCEPSAYWKFSRMSLQRGKCETHELKVGDSIPATLNLVLQRWLLGAQSARDLETVTLYPNPGNNEVQGFNAGILATPANSVHALGVVMTRVSGLGIAMLPNVKSDYPTWIDAIVATWAPLNENLFPQVGDWARSPRWMTLEETIVAEKIKNLEISRKETEISFQRKHDELVEELSRVRSISDREMRRLLTSQGDVLSSAVCRAFSDLGFLVEDMDAGIPPGQAKREDLRLRLPNSTWLALVEVKGYAKSGGKTSDFQDMARHVRRYLKDTCAEPDRVFYVVNIRFESGPPEKRGKILEGSEEDIAVFASDNGVVIATRELFLLHRDRHILGVSVAQKMLMEAVGRFEYTPKFSRD